MSSRLSALVGGPAQWVDGAAATTTQPGGSMAKTLDGVEAELRARIEWLCREHPGLWIESGARDSAKQQELWNKFRAAVAKYGPSWHKHAALAAKPGTSKHERRPAEAVDVGAPGGGFTHPGPRLAPAYGMHTPIKNEPWHMELAPGRKPLAARLASSKEEAMSIPDPVDAAIIPNWRASDGRPGVWVVKDDGGVFTYPAEAHHLFHGSMGGKPLNAPMCGIVAHSTGGYWLIGEDGGIFAFGDAPDMEPYSQFADEWRIGAHSMVDGEFDGQTLTLIADDGGFYMYAVKR